jgi:tetratricopeptide (TPR) repeat protein
MLRSSKGSTRWLGWAGVTLLVICALAVALRHMLRNAVLGQYTDAFSIATGVVGAVASVLAVVLAWVGRDQRPESSQLSQEDANIGASPLAPPVVSLRPPARRVRLQRELVKVTLARPWHRRGPRIHVLTGVGGVGKATVAALVASAIKKAGYPVWWVAASSPATLANDMLSVAKSLNATRGEIFRVRSGEINGPELVWSYLERIDQPWLMVLLNADNPSDLGDLAGGAIDGRGWLRAPRRGTVLVTSHHMDPSTWGSFARVHPLNHLTADEGAGILSDLAPSAGSLTDARQLAERLGGLPLALHLAGWYLARGGTQLSTFSDYRKALDGRFAEIMQRTSRVVGGGDRDTIMKIWELELDSLVDQGMTAARKLLRLLSCYAKATPIPHRLVNETTLTASGLFNEEQPGAIEFAMTGLIRVGLVRLWKPPTQRPDSNSPSALVVDRLIAETNLAHLADDPAHERIVRSAAAYVLAAVTERMSTAEREHWPAWHALSPHIRAVLPWLGDDTAIADDILSAAYRTVWGLRWGALYPAAEDLARATLRQAASECEIHPWTLELRRELATVLRARGRNEEAAVEFRAALDACNRLLGPNDMHTLRTRHGLARVIRNLGRYSVAEQETQAVLDARIRVHGEQHEYTLSSRHELARVLVDLGRYDEAEREYRTVLKARTRLLGYDSLWTLSTRHGLARVLRELGRYVEAESEIQTVLAARVQTLGEEHPHTLASRNELARVLLDTRRFSEAEQEYRALLRAQAGHRRSSLLRMLAAQHGLARLLQDTRHFEDAENEFSTVLEARTRLIGPEHPHTLSTRHFLATVWLDQGRYSEAVHELDAVLEARTRILGPEHPRTLATRHLLATAWLDQGRRSEAAYELEAVLQARTQILGPRHPDTVQTQTVLDGLAT